MARKTKKAPKAVSRTRPQESEFARMKRLVRERADLAVEVSRLSEATLLASADLWDGPVTATPTDGTCDGMNAAAERLVQLTTKYGEAVKQMHDHGAELTFIAAVAQGDADETIDIDEIRCVLLFAD